MKQTNLFSFADNEMQSRINYLHRLTNKQDLKTSHLPAKLNENKNYQPQRGHFLPYCGALPVPIRQKFIDEYAKRHKQLTKNNW